MAIYIDREAVPDINNIPSTVFEYVIKKHKAGLTRLDELYNYYIGEHSVLSSTTADDEVKVMANYAKYVVDIALGYYLGEPVKYDTNNKIAPGDSKTSPNSSVRKMNMFGQEQVEATVNRSGNLVRHEDSLGRSDVNIDRLINVYENQTIAEVDAKVGKFLGIFGEGYELLYANSDENPEPRSYATDPRNCVVVRDNTVEHKKMFGIVYEQRETIEEKSYYYITVYTDTGSCAYKTEDLENFSTSKVEGSEQDHYFGDIPIIEYQNNEERQGDFEQVTSLIDALNELTSDRITDKKKFVNSILALYGGTLDDDENSTQYKKLVENRFIDRLPPEAKLEYIQKVFDESSIEVLANSIIREIHKQTMTIDMTDEKFSGNSSGQAMKLKLLTMNMLVKNKIRQMEKGLKKRFELYNNWLSTKGEMTPVSKNDVDVIFTISMPMNELEIVQLVTSLQGIVDDKTLLSQLWFIKDPDDAFDKIKAQKAAQQNVEDKPPVKPPIDGNKSLDRQRVQPARFEPKGGKDE